MMCGVIIIAPTFIPIFLGRGFEPSIKIMQILSPIILFIGLGGIIGSQYLLPTQRQKQYTTAVIIGAITNVILNSILIKIIGAQGAAIATVFAEASCACVQIYFVRKEFDFKKILKKAIRYMLVSLIMMFFCMLIKLLINNWNNIYILAVQVVVGALTYIIMLLLSRDELLEIALKKILPILKMSKNRGD